MADDLSGWTLQKAEPLETSGWTLHPAEDLAPPVQTPSVGDTMAHAAGQGFTAGFGDEINGGIQALGDKLMGTPGTLGELYRHNRDAFRREDEAAREAHPVVSALTEGAASLPMSIATGPASGASKLAMLSKLGAQGALGALGTSKAATAGGDALNALGGLGLGVGLGAVGNKLGGFVGKAKDEVRLASADAAQAVALKAQKAADSARGAYGGDVASILDAAKSYEHALSSGLASPEQKIQAKSMLESPDFQALYQNALKNKLDMTAEKMGGRLLNSKAAYETADAAARAPEAVEQATEESMANPLRRQVLPRLLTYGERAVPLLVGHHFGGLPGAAAGLGMAAVMGKPGTALANMVKNPGVRSAMWSGLGGLTDNTLLPVARNSAGPAALELSPDVAAMVAALRAKKEPDVSGWDLQGGTP